MARLKVIGAVAVARTSDGSERYLYRGAEFDSAGFDEENVKHLLDAGLVSKVEKAKETKSSDADEQPTAQWSNERIVDWAGKQDPKIEFDANATKAQMLDKIEAAKPAS